jgi:hypothetical protein
MDYDTSDFDYDVALSFAGEDRAIAQAIAESLSNRKIRVFYDEFEESDLWGENLYDHLADVYSKRAAFCLMILSRNYAGKTWATHERRHAQARAFTENREYILPLKLDDTQIPGIESTVGYVDYRTSSVDKIVDLLESKLSAVRSGHTGGKLAQGRGLVLNRSILSLHLSDAALRIINKKDDGWECGFLLEILKEEIESARSMKLDMQYGFVSGKARRFEVSEFFKWTATQFELIARQAEAFQRFGNEGLNAALGPQEDKGDPVEICLIARKMGALYKWAAEWGMEFRSASVGDDFTKLLDLYSKSALILMECIEELHRGLRSSFDHWCSLNSEEKASHKARVEITLPSPDIEEIGIELKRLKKIYDRQ